MADPLTTPADVEERLGRPLTPDEGSRIDVVIQDVSAYLRVIAPRIPASAPIPDAVAGIAGSLVIQALATPPGSAPVSQETLGGYSVTYRTSADGMTLADAHLAVLAPWRRPRLGSVRIDPATAVAG